MINSLGCSVCRQGFKSQFHQVPVVWLLRNWSKVEETLEGVRFPKKEEKIGEVSQV